MVSMGSPIQAKTPDSTSGRPRKESRRLVRHLSKMATSNRQQIPTQVIRRRPSKLPISKLRKRMVSSNNSSNKQQMKSYFLINIV